MDEYKASKENFIKNFPPGIDVPRSLIALLEFQEQSFRRTDEELEYAGTFYLYEKLWEILPESGFIPQSIYPYFIPFGADVDGSIYLFWMYKNFSIEKCPIVFLGCSWPGNTILANTLNEFLALLSLGINELGYAVHFPPDWVNKVSDETETMLFRDWLHTNLGISVPHDPQKIVNDAKSNHPDFGGWIEERTGIPPEKMQRPRWE